MGLSRSSDDDLDTGAFERALLVGRNAAVGHQDVDLVDRRGLAQRRPTDLAVIDGHDYALGRAQQGAVGGGHVEVWGGQAMLNGQAITAEKQLVDVQAPQVLLGERANQGVGGAAQVPASDDHVDVGKTGQLDGDVDGAGDNGQVGAARQVAGDLEVGRPGAENDRVAGVDQSRRGRADAALLMYELR